MWTIDGGNLSTTLPTPAVGRVANEMATIRLKESSIPVIPHLGGISKNVHSGFLKNQQNSISVKTLPDTTIVIQPGSRWLKVGKAKAAFPAIVPHCIAYRVMDGNGSGRVCMYNSADSFTMPDQKRVREWFDEATGDKKVPPNFYQNLRSFNQQQAKKTQKIPIHNDQFSNVEYTTSKLSYLCGREALQLDPECKEYLLKWPLEGGTGCGRRECEDMERIWTRTISTELMIPTADLCKWSAVVIVEDDYNIENLKELTEMSLRIFKSVAFLTASQAACIGSGVTSAMVVDCGAQRTRVSVVEEGVISSFASGRFGGDSLLWMFVDLLSANNFPYIKSNPLIHRPSEFDTVERELWLKQCSLDENELTATAASVPVDFYHRIPGKDTIVYSGKMLHEQSLPLMTLISGRFWEEYLIGSPINSVSEDEQTIPKHYNCGNLFNMVRRCMADVQKPSCSVLFIGGGIPSNTIGDVLQLLSNNITTALERLDPGIDPRHIAWKGGAVFAKLDSFGEYCVDRHGWHCKGERLFAERLVF